MIPIADILRHREAFAYYGAAGTERHIDKKITHANSINVGLFDRVELGYDNDFEGNTVYHGKLLLWESEKVDAAVSAGWMNWDPKSDYGEPYVVARYGIPNGPRLHVGAMRNDRWRAMFGVDHGLGNDWTVAADYVSGPDAYVWLGATYNIAKMPGVSISGNAGVPIRRSDGYQYSVFVNYGFRF